MLRCACLAFAVTSTSLAGHLVTAGDKTAETPLIIGDAQGKDVKLKSWRLTTGVRRLPVEGAGKGPEYLEFRTDHSTTYQAGILTLVPVASIRKIDYDYERKSVTLLVAAADKDLTVTGTTRFNNINRLTIEGDADLGDLGFASVKLHGGNPKGGITGVRFPRAQPVVPFKGVTAVIVGEDKARPRHEVADLTALYHLADGTERLVPRLFFKKTVKLDLAKLAALRHVEPDDKKQTSFDFEVTLTSGEKHTLTLLTKVELEAGKSATLTGLFGRVPAGYELFPAHTIAEFRMVAEKEATP
jgi:hypothetical protein